MRLAVATTFDEAALLERVDHDLEFLAETVQILSAEAPPLVEEIRRAVAAGDAASVGRLGHTLKGMVSNFCAAETHARASEVEVLGKSGDLSSAQPAIQALERQLDALTSELLQFIRAKA
jgi:HPt (histidine-containing phosphotransfer) domain-containing protein